MQKQEFVTQADKHKCKIKSKTIYFPREASGEKQDLITKEGSRNFPFN